MTHVAAAAKWETRQEEVKPDRRTGSKLTPLTSGEYLSSPVRSHCPLSVRRNTGSLGVVRLLRDWNNSLDMNVSFPGELGQGGLTLSGSR